MRFSEEFYINWLQIGYASHLAAIRNSSIDDIFKLCGDFGLLVWIQVAVGVQRGLNLFMSQSVSDQEGLTAHLDQKAGVGMPEEIQTFGFYFYLFLLIPQKSTREPSGFFHFADTFLSFSSSGM